MKYRAYNRYYCSDPACGSDLLAEHDGDGVRCESCGKTWCSRQELRMALERWEASIDEGDYR